MEDKNTPVQPDAVEAAETRGRKVGAARFFVLLGRDLWPFYKASILCVLGFAPGYAAVLFSTMAASLPLCLLSGAVGGLIAAPVFCGMLDTILRALRDEHQQKEDAKHHADPYRERHIFQIRQGVQKKAHSPRQNPAPAPGSRLSRQFCFQAMR